MNSLIKDAPKEPIKTVHFPNVNEALERAQRDRENITACSLLIMAIIGLLIKFFTGSNFGWVVFGFMICQEDWATALGVIAVVLLVIALVFAS